MNDEITAKGHDIAYKFMNDCKSERHTNNINQNGTFEGLNACSSVVVQIWDKLLTSG